MTSFQSFKFVGLGVSVLATAAVVGCSGGDDFAGAAPAGTTAGADAGGGGGEASGGRASGGSDSAGATTGDGGTTTDGGNAGDGGDTAAAGAANGGSAGATNGGSAGAANGGATNGGSGGVAPTCTLDCGERGSCVEADGKESCACETGYAGALCDSCASGYKAAIVVKGTPLTCVLDEPTSPDIVLWLDGSKTDTLTYDAKTQIVSAWSSRVGVAKVTAPSVAARPKRTRSSVTFDGVDDSLNGTLPINTLAYTVFAVVEVDAAKELHTVLHGVEPITLKSGLLLDATKNGTNLRFLHTMPFGGVDSDAVNVSPFAMTGLRTLHATHTVLTHSAWNGGSYTAVVRSTPAFDKALDLRVGAYAGQASRTLKGSIAELIVYDAAVSESVSTKVRAYLDAKWNTVTPKVF